MWVRYFYGPFTKELYRTKIPRVILILQSYSFDEIFECSLLSSFTSSRHVILLFLHAFTKVTKFLKKELHELSDNLQPINYQKFKS